MAITDPALQGAYKKRALDAGVAPGYIDSFLKGDPNDFHRLETTWNAYGKDQWSKNADGSWTEKPMQAMDPAALEAQRAKGYGGQPTQYNAIDPRTVQGVNLGALGGDTATNFGIDNSPTGDSGIKPGMTNYAAQSPYTTGGIKAPGQYGGITGGIGTALNPNDPVSGPQVPGGTGGGLSEQLNKVLMEQLGALSKPVTANDATIAPQLAAQRLQSQREAERARMVAAERNAAQGLRDSGAMESDIRGIDEARAERNLGFQADTLANETQQRRQALQSMLGLGIGSDQFKQASEQQASQFASQMGLNWAQLDQQQKQYLMSLAQNQSQFQDTMGLNWTQLEQSGNLQALLGLLGVMN